MSRTESEVINVPYRDDELEKVKCKREGGSLVLRDGSSMGLEMFRMPIGDELDKLEEYQIERMCYSIEQLFKSTIQRGHERYKRKHREFLGIENGR